MQRKPRDECMGPGSTVILGVWWCIYIYNMRWMWALHFLRWTIYWSSIVILENRNMFDLSYCADFKCTGIDLVVVVMDSGGTYFSQLDTETALHPNWSSMGDLTFHFLFSSTDVLSNFLHHCWLCAIYATQVSFLFFNILLELTGADLETSSIAICWSSRK